MAKQGPKRRGDRFRAIPKNRGAEIRYGTMSTESDRLIENISLFFPAKLREEYAGIVKDMSHPDLAPNRAAKAAIEIFLEYQYAHGKNEEEAKYCAVREVLEGVDEIKELRLHEQEMRQEQGVES